MKSRYPVKHIYMKSRYGIIENCWYGFHRELYKDLYIGPVYKIPTFLSTLSGGITDLLLKVLVTEEDGSTVITTLRMYGANTEYVINRMREFQAIQYLSDAGFVAKLLDVFGNVMVQSFINARTLSPSDMRNPELAAEIAKQLHNFHQVKVPGSKEPQLWDDILKFFNIKSKHLMTAKQKRYTGIKFEEVQTEISQLKELTGCLNAPVVFAHNDQHFLEI